MSRILTYHITKEQNRMPIALFLRSMGYSSQNIIALKKAEDGILVNGIRHYVNYQLQTSDRLTIHIADSPPSEKILPAVLPFPIVYQDEDLLIINKPANMPIHPSQNNHDNTLANAAAYYFSCLGLPFTFRCINRLDRDTTGLTILAKHGVSAGILSSMVQNHKLKRQYLALLSGIPPEQRGCVSAPIGRKEGSAIERCVDFEKGEAAITHYALLKTFYKEWHGKKEPFSLASLQLETGRTHQIRVHMKYLGVPLPGDFLYHPDMRFINRQALHSHMLSFPHPITKKEMHFTAPLPHDMLSLLTEINF